MLFLTESKFLSIGSLRGPAMHHRMNGGQDTGQLHNRKGYLQKHINHGDAPQMKVL
jgi:hypothetical protein